jgi:hypothetical protein
MHPLINDLTQLKEEELNQKFGDLMKRFNQAARFGPASVIPQLQMLISDYQAEMQRRGVKAMEEMRQKMDKDGKAFKNIIDIQ